MKISALYCTYNEEEFIQGSLELMLPFVEEVIVVDNGSTDNTLQKIKQLNSDKIKVYDFPRREPVDMGEMRNFSLSKATGDWFIQVDADEYYPPESLTAIRQAIENATDELSFRIAYYNLSWRPGYVQKDFGHYPDRIYKREAVEGYKGVLPKDMTYVKKEYLLAPNKPFGDIGVLEYDNMEDKSFEHPKQPIRKDIFFYHLARTRGYNYEYEKWKRYNRNTNPTISDQEVDHLTRINQWVSGQYEIVPHDVPAYIPQQTIKKKKVSIVITNFNYGHFLAQAIESAIAQVYKPHEIIVVDDCSSDNSRQVMEYFGSQIIPVFRSHNGGPGACRNDGIARTTGDYFILLDADDRFHPDLLRQLVKAIGEAQVCYPDMEVISNRPGVREGVYRMPDYTPERMLESQCVPSVCAMIDRHAFDVSGGFDHKVLYEDWDFFLNLSEKLKLNFVHVQSPLLKYRAHPGCQSDFADAHQQLAYQSLRSKYPNIKV